MAKYTPTKVRLLQVRAVHRNELGRSVASASRDNSKSRLFLLTYCLLLLSRSHVFDAFLLPPRR